MLPRADAGVGDRPRGVAVYVTSRFAIFKHALTSPTDPAQVQVPPPGYERGKVTRYYSAYVAC